MFYKQFLEIIDVLNPEFVESFDYWLATLPRHNQKNITASLVSARLDVKYILADAILKFSEKKGILQKGFLVRCPKCDYSLGRISQDEILDIVNNGEYCDECEEDRSISLDDIYVVYDLIKQPDVSEKEIARAIEEKMNFGESSNINFIKAGSVSSDKTTLYECFYNPNESAYNKFKDLRDKLDMDYGNNTTAKGAILEELVLEMFNHIKYIKATNMVRTKTNQFDCTAICAYKTSYLSVFSYLAPYFIIECKNEPKKKPDNTYCNKLLSIMDTNEAQIGIVWGRIEATSTCFNISREHYLKHCSGKKHQIILTFSDTDLNYLIDEKVNLLEYLEYKIFQVTSDSKNTTFKAVSKSCVE